LQKTKDMRLKEILAVTGKPGLYVKIGGTKNGIIVESLIDKKRIPVYTSDKMMTLADISMFTTGEDVSLKDVFKKIFEKENGAKSIDHKSDDKKLKEYFEQVMPEYDKDRVYVSDIRKVFNWYNMLVANNLLDLSDEPEEATEEEVKKEEENPDKPKKTEKKVAEKKPAGTKSTKEKKSTT
jgi:hypothetical protein